MRYTVNISFYPNNISFRPDDLKRTPPIAGKVKTLNEARKYKVLLDETVEKACIVDNVTNKIIEKWKVFNS